MAEAAQNVMTPAQARQALRPRLRFGDAKQIEALAVLRKACPACDGTGGRHTRYNGRTYVANCGDCGGTGRRLEDEE